MVIVFEKNVLAVTINSWLPRRLSPDSITFIALMTDSAIEPAKHAGVRHSGNADAVAA